MDRDSLSIFIHINYIQSGAKNDIPLVFEFSPSLDALYLQFSLTRVSLSADVIKFCFYANKL